MNYKNTLISKSWAPFFIVFFSLLSIAGGISLFNNPQKIFTSSALWGNDLPVYQYGGEMISLFWANNHSLWGYCPYYMAGYPFVQYTSCLIWGFAFIALSCLPMGLRSAIFMFLTLALVPIAYFSSAKCLTKDKKSAVMASALATCHFFMGPLLFFWWLGAVETVLSLIFALLAFSLFIRWSKENNIFTWFSMVICGTLALMSHKTGGLYLAISMILAFPFLIKATSMKKWKFLLCSSIAGALMLSANLFWIIPFIKYIHYRVEVPKDLWSNIAGGNIIKDFFSLFTPAGSLPMLWFLLIFGVIGFISWVKKEKYFALTYGIGLIAWTLLSYLGDRFEALQAIQPRRFLLFVLGFLVPLAVMGLEYSKEKKSSRFVALTLLIFIGSSALTPNAYRYLLKFRLEPQISPPIAEILAKIKSENFSGRVLIEETAGSKLGIIPYEGSHFYTLVHYMTNMEAFIGYNHGLAHSLPAMKDGKLMGKPIEQVTIAELEEFLDVYNIGSILCFSDAAKALLENAVSLVTKVGNYGSRRQLALYRVNNPKGFIMGGKGDVKIEVNNIYVQNLVTYSDSVVIKYHWDEALRCKPDCVVEKALIEIDKVGFIKVHNPPSSFNIYFEY